jgi:glyoxylase-like metal-dependent hydrolase (beta-lactamase superfamily II)
MVYVHERGAPHLIDPSGLLKSAERLYGDEMERLWGEVAPVPEERVHALAGGETVEGMRVAYTPGHASHHVCYLDEDTGEAFVGDVGGVRMPGGSYTVVPTPPPDIDVEAWLRSLDEVEAWQPTALCLTHFGRFEDVSEQIDRMREELRVGAEKARTMEAAEFAEWSEARTRAAVDDEDTVEALLQAAPPDHLGMGLRRYWERKAS